MELSIWLAVLVQTRVLTEAKAKKVYEKLRYKNFPLDFAETNKIVKGVFQQIDDEEKLDKKLKGLAPKK